MPDLIRDCRPVPVAPPATAYSRSAARRRVSHHLEPIVESPVVETRTRSRTYPVAADADQLNPVRSVRAVVNPC